MDAAAADARAADAPRSDGAAPGGPPDAGGLPRLSSAGLYADFAARTLAEGVVEFEPTHRLWSDAADKRRFVKLPPGTQIDTSRMDHWVFPVGTRLWKEFSHGGVPLETRLIERTGPGSEDYTMVAFVWSDDGSDAYVALHGRQNIRGTQHDAPDSRKCWSCHVGEAGRVLGLSAIQLSRPGAGVTLRALAERGLLSAPPPPDVDYPVPGDPTTAAALGYLHANCGHCHNAAGGSWPDTQMVLRLEVGERTPEASALWQSVIGHRLQSWMRVGVTDRVVAGDPLASAVYLRMLARGDRDAMPPLASEQMDLVGSALVHAWIDALPP
jgi:hypothetical protein